MSMVQVAECKTADDVLKIAREVQARRRAMRVVHKPTLIPKLHTELLTEKPQTFMEVTGTVNAAFTEDFGATSVEGSSRMYDDDIPIARPKIREIQRAVCVRSETPLVEILARRRDMKVVRPRQIAMYLCKKLTLKSLPEIGRAHGGRDHTTVLHAVRKLAPMDQEIEALIEAGAGLRRLADAALAAYDRLKE